MRSTIFVNHFRLHAHDNTSDWLQFHPDVQVLTNPPFQRSDKDKMSKEAEKEVTNMEDSGGHGQDIGSDTLLGDSRVMDTSEEEEEEEEKTSRRASRRPRRSRVSYKVCIYSYA